MAEPVIEVEGLSVVAAGRRILDDVDLTVGDGEFVSLIGPNGAGKSTLIRCLDGLVAADRGQIRIGGRPLEDYSRRELARIVCYVPQTDGGALPFAVGTFVEMGRFPHLGSWAAMRRDDVEAVREALEMTGTAQLADRAMASLSGGERQLVLIAAALAQGSRILLLDEPTTFLDYRHQAQVVDLLAWLHRGRGLTVVLATHDLNRAMAASDTVLALRAGRVVLRGPIDEAFDADRLAAIYDTRFELVAVAGGQPPLVIPARNGR